MTTPPTFEIVPGQSIGPVRLGMTVADVAALGEQKVKEIEPAFDAQGACRQIRATVPTHPLERPRFSLAGRLLNGLPATEVDALFMSLAVDVQHEHALTHAVSIGLFAVNRERLEQYEWLFVVRPGDTQSVAWRGLVDRPRPVGHVPRRLRNRRGHGRLTSSLNSRESGAARSWPGYPSPPVSLRSFGWKAAS